MHLGGKPAHAGGSFRANHTDRHYSRQPGVLKSFTVARWRKSYTASEGRRRGRVEAGERDRTMSLQRRRCSRPGPSNGRETDGVAGIQKTRMDAISTAGYRRNTTLPGAARILAACSALALAAGCPIWGVKELADPEAGGDSPVD